MAKYKHKKKVNRLSRHHIIPTSRGGTSKLENIAKITIKEHQDYHTLFSNKKPDEIINYLVNNYWNGKWEYVEKAYNNRNV